MRVRKSMFFLPFFVFPSSFLLHIRNKRVLANEIDLIFCLHLPRYHLENP